MSDPQLYSKSNDVTKHDAIFFMKNYLPLIKWKNNANILDVGSGDGAVILDIILPKFPENFNKLVCVDKSDEMVQFAKTRCNNPKVDFIPLDITSTKIPSEFHQHFDHIFSFHCLHWIENQRQAFKNLYEMLKPGGDMLIMFLVSNPFMDISEKMAEIPKWSSHMVKFRKYISPYSKSNNPEKELENLLKEAGFIIHVCEMEDRIYTFPNSRLFDLSLSGNPFMKDLLEDEVASFTNDYINELKKLKAVSIEIEACSSKVKKIHYSYKIFAVHVSK